MEVGWGPDLQGEISNAGKPEAERHGCWKHQEARLSVLPAEDRALSVQAVPQLDEEPVHPAVLVVPVPESNPGAPLQGVPGVEGPTEGTVGGGADGDREVEDRWKIRDLLADERCSQAILDFLASTDVGRRVPAEENDAVSAVS